MSQYDLIRPTPDNPVFGFDLAAHPQGLAVIIPLVIFGLLFGHVAYTDLFRGRIISNHTTAAIACLSFAIGPQLIEGWVAHTLIGLTVVVVLFCISIAGGMGMGDVKLYAGLAPLLGPTLVLVWVFSSMIILLYSIPIMVRTVRENRRRGVKAKRGRRLGTAPAGPGIVITVPLILLLAGVNPLYPAVLAATTVLAVPFYMWIRRQEIAYQEFENRQAALHHSIGSIVLDTDGNDPR